MRHGRQGTTREGCTGDGDEGLGGLELDQKRKSSSVPVCQEIKKPLKNPPGLRAQSPLASNFSFGTSSSIARTVPSVPPEMLPLIAQAEVDVSIAVVGPTMSLRVLLARWTTISEGTESSPDPGIIMDPVLVAA